MYQTSNNFHHRDRQSERSKWRYFSIVFLTNWQVFSFARLSQLSISLYIGYIRRATSFLPFFQRIAGTAGAFEWYLFFVECIDHRSTWVV